MGTLLELPMLNRTDPFGAKGMFPLRKIILRDLFETVLKQRDLRSSPGRICLYFFAHTRTDII